jgi:ABC-2 type transport system ATP-binding protein
MQIILENTGKRYMHQWIFRDLNADFKSPGHYGILGNNGKGKSTLLKIISGILSPSQGKIRWQYQGADISAKVFRYLSMASPHLETIEEFSIRESFLFHQKFKPFLPGQDSDSLTEISGLSGSADKPIKYFSSGMKQRVKLILAVMSNVPFVLLDEPCTNLDNNSVEWYQELISRYAGKRLFIIASNNKDTECFSCNEFLKL